MSDEIKAKMISVDGIDVEVMFLGNYSLGYEYELFYTDVTDNSKRVGDCFKPFIDEYKIAAEADVGFNSAVHREDRYTVEYLRDGVQKSFRTSDKHSAYRAAIEHRNNNAIVGVSVNVTGNISIYP